MSAALEAAVETTCYHCAEPVPPEELVVHGVGGAPRSFCCQGCAGAAELIEELGLGAYYQRREQPAPNRGAVPDPGLARYDDPELQRGFVLHEPDGSASVQLSVGGMRCTACSWLLEERLARLPGVLGVRVGLSSQRAQLRWDPSRLLLSDVLGRIAELGYSAAPYVPDREEERLRAERAAALRRLGVSGLGAMQGMMLSVGLYVGAFGDLEAVHRDLLRLGSFLIATPVLWYAGLPFLQGAWRDLRLLRVGADVPIALALLGAYLASSWSTFVGGGEVYFDSVCMFVFFLTSARMIEGHLRTGSELRVRALQRRAPEVARRVRDGVESEVPVAALEPGDHIVVHAGETIPADGQVLSGRSHASEALLTGEPIAVPKLPGSAVIAGSSNVDGTLTVRVERTGPHSTLATLGRLLDRALLEKPPVAELANRVARFFLAAVLLVAAVTGAVWWFLEPGRAIPVVISVLIATCPCALSLATPAALVAATHGLAAHGFLVTRGWTLETLARVSHVVFDKTGTLTQSAPEVKAMRIVRDGITEAEVVARVRALEAGSNHPLARGLRVFGEDVHCPVRLDAGSLRVMPGRGVEAREKGRVLRIGRASWACPDVDSGAADVVLADDAGAIACFEFETRLRPGARAVVDWLQRAGLAVTLLSGDPSRARVSEVAGALSLDDAREDVSPGEKLAALRSLTDAGEIVLAVGDGVNDAPLLGGAQVSVAMGSGADLARIHADAVLLDDQIERLPLALAWARRTRSVVRQNFAWALVYNAAFLPLAVLGVLPPWLAALGMSASSLVVVANSTRLRKAPRVALGGPR